MNGGSSPRLFFGGRSFSSDISASPLSVIPSGTARFSLPRRSLACRAAEPRDRGNTQTPPRSLGPASRAGFSSPHSALYLSGPELPAQTTPKQFFPQSLFSTLTHPPVISTGMNDSFRFSLRGWPILCFLPIRRRRERTGPLFLFSIPPKAFRGHTESCVGTEWSSKRVSTPISEQSSNPSFAEVDLFRDHDFCSH